MEKGVSSCVPVRVVDAAGVVEVGESATEKTEKELSAEIESPFGSLMV